MTFEQDHFLLLAHERGTLDSGADGHHLVRVHALVGLAPEERAHGLLHRGHARHPADEHDVLDLADAEARVAERLTADVDRALDEILGEAFEGLAIEHALQVQRFVATRGDDERQIDLGLARSRELALRLLGGVTQTLERHAVLAKIDAVLLLEPGHEPIDDASVEVLAAEECVARRADNLENAVCADFQDADVERATAEVVDRDGAVEILAETVGQRRGRRLVDDADDIETRDGASVLGGLALVVVEVRGHGDHGLLHGLAQVVLCDHPHLLEHHRADLGDRVGLVAQADAHVVVRAFDDGVARGHDGVLDLRRVPLSSDQSLGRVHRVFGVGDRLTLGDVPNEALARLGHGDDARRRLVPAAVRDHDGGIALQDGHARVGRPEIDADDSLHR